MHIRPRVPEGLYDPKNPFSHGYDDMEYGMVLYQSQCSFSVCIIIKIVLFQIYVGDQRKLEV